MASRAAVENPFSVPFLISPFWQSPRVAGMNIIVASARSVSSAMRASSSSLCHHLTHIALSGSRHKW